MLSMFCCLFIASPNTAETRWFQKQLKMQESSCQFSEPRADFPPSECRSSSCQVMMPAKVFRGRGSPLFMYLLRPVSFSSLRLYLDLTAFWTQYPGSRHGDTSMLRHKHKQSESQKTQRPRSAQFYISCGIFSRSQFFFTQLWCFLT